MNNESDYQTSTSQYIFYINVCRPTLAQACFKVKNGADTAGCQTWNGGQSRMGSYSTGVATALPKEKGKGILYTFTGGDGVTPRSMQIAFVVFIFVLVSYFFSAIKKLLHQEHLLMFRK